MVEAGKKLCISLSNESTASFIIDWVFLLQNESELANEKKCDLYLYDSFMVLNTLFLYNLSCWDTIRKWFCCVQWKRRNKFLKKSNIDYTPILCNLLQASDYLHLLKQQNSL